MAGQRSDVEPLAHGALNPAYLRSTARVAALEPLLRRWPAPGRRSPRRALLPAHATGAFPLTARLFSGTRYGSPGLRWPGHAAPGTSRARVAASARARSGNRVHGDAEAPRPPGCGTRDDRPDGGLVSLAGAGLLGHCA